jgi:hypothetical protein
MSRVQGVKENAGFGSSDLAHDDSVRAVTQGSFEEVGKLDLTGAGMGKRKE